MHGLDAQTVISASDLYNYAKDNEAAFDSRFKNKTIRVKGLVGEITKNTNSQLISGYSVRLYTSTDYLSGLVGLAALLEGRLFTGTTLINSAEKFQVSVFFTESNATQITNLQSGDEIIIEGVCTGRGRIDKTVYLNNCKLINHKSRSQLIREEEERNERRMREVQRKQEERLREEERIRQIREYEENLSLQRELLLQADNFSKEYRFESALDAYQKALQTSPENKAAIMNKIESIRRIIQQYNNLIEQASNFEEKKNYAQAKDAWQKANNLIPQKEIQDRIDKNNQMLLFLKERESTTYNYRNRFSLEYFKLDNKNKSTLTGILLETPNVAETEIKIISQSDTAGYTRNILETNLSDAALKHRITDMTNKIKLDAQLNGYPVASEAFFDYTISSEETVIKIKKRFDKYSSKGNKHTNFQSEVTNLLSVAPYGDFTVQFNKTTINGISHIESKVLKHKGVQGTSNALLSLLVPGLGDHRVTYGEKNGIGKTLLTYGLIGAGVGLKFYSNSEYDKYHAATTQEVMDEHYRRANYGNQAFYACVGAGAFVWISDIIWVWKKGAENSRASKRYRQWYLGTYYDPSVQATGLSYTIHF